MEFTLTNMSSEKEIWYQIQPDVATPLPLDFYVNGLRLTSRTNLWRWAREGLHTVRIGGRVYITQAELQRFLNEKSR